MGVLISPAAGGNAAGIGGIAGTVFAVLLGRRLAGRKESGAPALPRIVAVLSAASPRRPACVASEPPPDRTGLFRVDSSDRPRVE